MKIRDKVFGAPVSEDIIEIFKKLQEGTPDVNPGAPVSEQVNNKFYLGERTPFIRMWTALDIIGLNKNFKDSDLVGPLTSEQEAQKKYYDTKYYVINDNKQNSYGGDPNESIGNRISQLQDNQFSKPPAGITGISTKTEGALGVIKRTSVSFVVHSKDDFEKIFLPFFLRPGTNVCVDFGWTVDGEDTSLYSIEDVVNSTIGSGKVTEVGMKNFYADIYGVGQEGDKDYKPGYLRKSRNYGRVNTLFGEVLNYSANVQENGSYECSLEFVSQNTALIDTEINEDNNLKFVFTSLLEDTLLAGFLGADENAFHQSVETLSLLSNEKKRELQNKFFDSVEENALGDIGSMARKLGIFHQDFAKGLNRDTDEVLYINFGLFEDIFLNNLLIKTNDGKSNKYDCKFVSHDCYARWNENLFLRQTEQLLPNEDLPVFLYPSSDWSETYNSDKRLDTDANITVATTFDYTIVPGDSLGKIANLNGTSVELIQSENQIENPNSIQVGQVIRIPKNKTEAPDSDIVELDKAQNRIPIRELFINAEVIKKAFATKQNVNDALIMIFDEINDDSGGIFDIKMISNNQGSTNIGFHDKNLLPPSEANQLIFDVTSGNSIVSNLDLKFEMPKGGLGSMIAIKGYEGKDTFFDVQQLDDFRLLDVLDKDNIGFQTENEKEVLQIRSLPRRLGRDESNLGKSMNLPFDYENVLGGLSDIAEEYLESMNANLSSIEDSVKTFDDYVESVSSKLETIEAKETEPKVKLKPTEDNKDNTIYASSPRDRRQKQAYLDVYLGNEKGAGIAPVLPLSLTLNVYGNNYLTIGDSFGVNNLPKVYKDSCLFQIIGIEDKLTTTGWETTYETVFRILPSKKKLAGDASNIQVEFASEYLDSILKNQGGIPNNALPGMAKTSAKEPGSIVVKAPFDVKTYTLEGGVKPGKKSNPNVFVNSIYPPNNPPKTAEELAYLHAFSVTMEQFNPMSINRLSMDMLSDYDVFDTYQDDGTGVSDFFYYHNTKDNQQYSNTIGKALDKFTVEAQKETSTGRITIIQNSGLQEAYKTEFEKVKKAGAQHPEQTGGIFGFFTTTTIKTILFPEDWLEPIPVLCSTFHPTVISGERDKDDMVPVDAELYDWIHCQPQGKLSFAKKYPLNISSQFTEDGTSIEEILDYFVKSYDLFYKSLNTFVQETTLFGADTELPSYVINTGQE